MKKIFLMFAVLIISMGCKEKEESKEITGSLEKGCYVFESNGAVISFEIEEVGETVTGKLSYLFAEKDKNVGKFSGNMKNNLLIGDYTFKSEGTESIREVAFKVEEDRLIEGYGETEIRGDKMCFKDPKSLNYESGSVLTKTSCEERSVSCLIENNKVFSKLTQKCMSFDEFRYKLNPLVDGSKVEDKPAYLHFNEENSMAEVFLPNFQEGLILDKTQEGNWEKDEYTLISWKGFVLQKSGNAVFGG